MEAARRLLLLRQTQRLERRLLRWVRRAVARGGLVGARLEEGTELCGLGGRLGSGCGVGSGRLTGARGGREEGMEALLRNIGGG